ncbi:MAG: sulfite exporter TauE/SafE family protein [Planctomycetes bacterium]|nr:sulfite exporter TauE/SafE family protein [Planctomycetota bacterium]
MVDLFAHPATLVALGLIIGFVGSLVGVGGGFLMVPYFTLLLGWSPATAVGTSLAVIVANASSGVLGFARQRRIDFLVGTILGIATIPGAVLGKLANAHLPSAGFKVIFGVMVAVAALVTALFRAGNRPGLAWFRRGRQRRFSDAFGETYDYSLNLWSAAAASVFMGFVSGLFGVGGGFIHVPLLILLYGMPAHVAMATSHYVLVITTGVGAVEYAITRHVNVSAFVWMGGAAFLAAQLGVRTAARLSGRFLRLALAAVLLAVAGLMIFEGIRT